MKKKQVILLAMLLTACGSITKAQVGEEINKNYDYIMNQIKAEKNNNYNIKTIGILVYDGFADLDAIGIQSDFSSVMGTKVFFIAPESGTIHSGEGNTYQVDTSIDQVSHLDVLVIPGGLASTYLLSKNGKVLNWVRKIDRTSTFTASVCTGAWILGASGVLKGRNATTHWYRGEENLAKYGAKYQNKRYVRDGKYWTAAGVSAGIDMGLAMIVYSLGKTYSKISALNLQYDPQPPVIGNPEQNDPKLIELMTKLYDVGLAEGIKAAKK